MVHLIHTFQARIAQLARARYRHLRPLSGWQIIDLLDVEEPRPAPTDPRWRPIQVGEIYGGPGQYAWLRADLPALDEGPLPVLLLDLFDYTAPAADGIGAFYLMRPEGILFAEGIPGQPVNRGHGEVWLRGAKAGPVYVAVAHGYTREVRRLHRAELGYLDADTDALYHDASVILGLIDGAVAPTLAEWLAEALDHALRRVDWRDDQRLQGVAEARALLRELAFTRHDPASPQIHAVGHAHLDLGWLWPLSYSPGKGLRTARTQLNLIERFPRYTFLQSQAQLYEAMRRADPALFEEIREQIRAGRWNATGATWVEMDTNLPNGESLVRQFLYGMRYFQQMLGARPEVFWLPDCFGFSAAIPQIMRQCGVRYFFTSKMSWNDTNRLPHDTFIWRGLDGSEVLAHMATTRRKNETVTNYEGRLTPHEAVATWESYKDKALNRHTLVAYGYGDGGGGPDRDTVERLQRYHDGVRGVAHMQPSSAEAFFHALERDLRGQPARWVGELYFELHRGCYTSQARVKRYNRKLEAALHDAEWLRAWLFIQAGLPYPRAELRRAWEILLTNQFHDILPGSSIRETYLQAEAEYAEALALTEKLIAEGLAALAAQVGGEGWLVVNSVGHPRDAVVTLDAELPEGATLRDSQDRVCPWQRLDNGQTLVKTHGVPPFGCERIRIDSAAPLSGPGRAPLPDSDLSVSARHLENATLRLELDEAGRITRIYDKVAGREILPPRAIGNQFQIFQDRPAYWDAWEVEPDFDRRRLPDPQPSGARVIENGPVRVAVEVNYAFGQSHIRQVISLEAAQWQARFDTEVDWHERHTLLKVAFPLDLRAARATFEIQHGALERPAHRNTSWDMARFEVPMQRWMDLSEAGYGVALLNDCKYGGDILDNVMRLSLLRSPTAPDSEADQGLHRFSYALQPHEGAWHAVVKKGIQFNQPLRVHPLGGTGAANPMPALVEGVEGLDRGIIDTLKLAEDSDDLIVRFYEPYGASGRYELRFFRAPRSVQEVNLLEEPAESADPGALEFEDNWARVALRPFQIRTLRVRF